MTNRDTHLDMESLVRQVEEQREDKRVQEDSQLARAGIVQGEPAALQRLSMQARRHLYVNASEDPDFGPRQVESFLRFMDEGLESELELAEMDNIVYDSLGEHRILGRRKSKKL